MSNVIEKIKDLALEAVGQGESGEFNDRVKEHAKKHNVSPDQAKKAVFLEYLSYARSEVGSNKAFESGSRGIKSFEAALRVIAGAGGIEMLKNQAKQTALSRPKKFVNISIQDQQAVERYYERKYQGKPNHATLRDSAESVKDFDILLSNFENDPRVINNSDIMSSLLDPDLGADIGQALLEQENFERHERRFNSRQKFGKSCESFKRDSIETLKTIFGRPLGDLIKSGYRFARDPSIAHAAKIGWEGTKYTTKTLMKGGQLLFNTVRTTLSGANALRHAIA